MQSSSPAPHPGVGPREFVCLVAAMMTVNALGIDTMLPALPAIGRALGVADANATQWVIAAYMFGFGAMQLVYGPLADRFGRRPVLLVTLAGFVVASVVCSIAASFPLLIAARVAQGCCSASTRVLVVSVVRDCYAGRRMARVMSLAQMIFFVIPILAPSIGAAILTVGPWRWIFWWLALYAAAVLAWTALRLPETLRPADRRPLDFGSLAAAWKLTIGNRFSRGYALASGVMFGALMGYINTSQQIVGGVFGRPDLFAFAFAGVAGAMGLATFLNSRIVERVGTRRISHAALLAVIGIAALHLLVWRAGLETLWSFLILQALQMACFGLIGSNFSSMAMEPVGHIAGTASSVQGFVSTILGAGLGIAIGQAFDGTTAPVAIGFLALGLTSLILVLATERWRLFRPQHPDPLPR